MPELKPVYLVSGDDDAKIDAWRARVRRRAEEELGPGGLESFYAANTEPGDVAAALATLTFATGTRYLLVEGVNAWKARELEPLAAALADMPPETVLVLVVRGKPLKQLVDVVKRAGGELREYAAPKPWELPRWAAERAREEGLELDKEAAKALVSAVGTGQQQLARELEKLALAVHPSERITPEDVEAHASAESSPQAYGLADALVAGDLGRTLALAEDLREHGEPPGRLLFPIVRRLREVHRAAALLDSGTPEQDVAAALRAPPWLAKRTVASAKKADRAALERALCELAELEIELRSGELSEDAAFTLALSRAAG